MGVWCHTQKLCNRLCLRVHETRGDAEIARRLCGATRAAVIHLYVLRRKMLAARKFGRADSVRAEAAPGLGSFHPRLSLQHSGFRSGRRRGDVIRSHRAFLGVPSGDGDGRATVSSEIWLLLQCCKASRRRNRNRPVDCNWDAC